MANTEQTNNKNVSLSLIAEYGGSESESDTETRSNTTGNDSDAPKLSEMVLKNNIINACAHGPLSRSKFDSEDVTRHMIIDNCESGVVEYEVTEYRDLDTNSDTNIDMNSESSSSSDSSIDYGKAVAEASSGDEFEECSRGEKPEPVKVSGELGLDDLPPIEDLAISLPAQECTKIGTIASIVDRLVIVSAFPETPAVDLDSVLFLENGAKALGKVFDVFGPVAQPHYCVRFNSVEHVRDRGIQPGMDVFIAPQSHHTNYVFLAELMKIKGSDASWLNDIEPPPNQVEYSDDEEERKATRARKEQRQKNNEDTNVQNDGETSKSVRKVPERRNQRPSDSSSRFGSSPSRVRNPFSAGSRRSNPNTFPRFTRPWPVHVDVRTLPPHPNDPGGPYSAPPFQNGPIFPPLFNTFTPPPYANMFQFGNNPRMHNPMPAGALHRHGNPVFGSAAYNMAGPHPRWANHGPPPPPGT